MLEKLKTVDVIQDGMRSEFWALYLKLELQEELEVVKQMLLSCTQDKLAYMQGRAMTLLEIIEKPKKDLEDLLTKESGK